jgi:MFS family permease
VGGGALFTSCRVLVLVLFGPADRPRAARIFMLGIFVASAMGPVMAAALIEHGVWQDVFYGVLPLSLLAMLGAWLLLPDTPPRGNAGVGPAIAPLLLFGAAVVALQAAMSEARFDIFSHPLRLTLVAGAGALLLGAFLWQQWHHDTPVLRVRGLRDPVYLTGLGLYFLYYLISNLAGYVFPIYAEQGLGLPLQTTGWLNTFSAGVSVVGIYVYQKTAHRMPRKKPLIALGLVVMAAAALWFSGMPAGASASALLPGLFAKGMFGVMMIIPVAGLTFSALEREDFVHGYRGKNLVRQIGSSFASALGAVLMQNRQFALHTRMSNAIGQRPEITEQWLGGAQASMTAQGMDAGHAHLAAVARLAGIVEQQATLIACEDLYRLLAAVALCAVVLVVVQKRLR